MSCRGRERFCRFGVDSRTNTALLIILHRAIACRGLVIKGGYGATPYQCFDRRERTKVISVVESGRFGLDHDALPLPADIVGGTQQPSHWDCRLFMGRRLHVSSSTTLDGSAPALGCTLKP